MALTFEQFVEHCRHLGPEHPVARNLTALHDAAEARQAEAEEAEGKDTAADDGRVVVDTAARARGPLAPAQDPYRGQGV